MSTNYVVLRRSPHWPTFDLAQTRAFMAQFGDDHDMIIRFAAVWDSELRLDFLGYRQAMKEIALACAHQVRGCVVISHDRVDELLLADDDLLFFTDDDDWTAPHLFESLRDQGPSDDGWLWRSIFVGKLFTDTPMEKSGTPVVQERPRSDVVYTNNYAVSGAAWKRLGAKRLLEHYDAQPALDQGLFQPRRSDEFLSAANKHLCCTVAIDYNQRAPEFMKGLSSALLGIVEEVEGTTLSEQTNWIAEPLARFVEVNRIALGHLNRG